MKEFAVTCRAEGAPVDAAMLGTQLVDLLTKLKDFGPIGRIRNDGTRYQATLVVATDNETDARMIARSAVFMAASAVGLPRWPLEAVEAVELAPI